MSSQPAPVKRYTIPGLRDMKGEGKRFTMVTAYDYVQAKTVDDAGVEVILVGDSLSNVLLGHEDIDEATDAAVAVEEALAETGVDLLQGAENFAHRGSGHLDLGRPSGK